MTLVDTERSLIFRGEHGFRAARVLRGIEGMMQELPQEHGRIHRRRQLKAHPPREAFACRAAVGFIGCSGRRHRRGSGSGLEGIQIRRLKHGDRVGVREYGAAQARREGKQWTIPARQVEEACLKPPRGWELRARGWERRRGAEPEIELGPEIEPEIELGQNPSVLGAGAVRGVGDGVT